MSTPLPTNARDIKNPIGSGDERYIEVDRYNRYVLPDPVTGQQRSWTRVTTVAKALDDTYNIQQWQMRMVAFGIAISPHLVAQAASFRKEDVVAGDDKNVRKDLQDIAQRALEAAGGDQGSRLGTALHNFTDRIDHGERDVQAPPPYDKALHAYVQLIEQHRLQTNPEWIERIVVHPELGVAGKLDRLFDIEDHRELIVGDLKSQKTMDFGALGIAVQLACYANATYVWDVDAETYTVPPLRNRSTALVMHVPATRPGEATLYGIDIAKGLEYLQLALAVRAARSSQRNLMWRVTEPLVAPEPYDERDRELKAIEMLSQATSRKDLEDGAKIVRQYIWSDKIEQHCAALWERLPAREG